MVSYEMAVALICPNGHREATLKSHWSPNGAGGKCSRCRQQLTVEREALIRTHDTHDRVYTNSDQRR